MLFRLYVSSLATIFLLKYAHGECCRPKQVGIPPYQQNECANGKNPGWGCCGVGSCNIFCCDCSGGCLKADDDTEVI